MIEFTVQGVPVTKGSMRAITSHTTGRAVVIHQNPKGLAEWCAKIEYHAAKAMEGRPCLTDPLRVVMAFDLPKPKNRPKLIKTWPDKRPDIDKLIRAALDAMTHVVWEDDAQVVRVYASKQYAWDFIEGTPAVPGLRVSVEEEEG